MQKNKTSRTLSKKKTKSAELWVFNFKIFHVYSVACTKIIFHWFTYRQTFDPQYRPSWLMYRYRTNFPNGNSSQFKHPHSNHGHFFIIIFSIFCIKTRKILHFCSLLLFNLNDCYGFCWLFIPSIGEMPNVKRLMTSQQLRALFFMNPFFIQYLRLHNCFYLSAVESNCS